MEYAIKKVSASKMQSILEHKEPKGLFYWANEGIWLACDNRKGETWLEEFKSKSDCFAWLKDEMEVDTFKDDSDARMRRILDNEIKSLLLDAKKVKQLTIKYKGGLISRSDFLLELTATMDFDWDNANDYIDDIKVN